MSSVKQIVLIVLMFSVVVFAQPPEIHWARMYDWEEHEKFNDIYTIPGDGYVLCGVISPDPGSNQNEDMLVMRIDDNGNEIWHNRFGTEDIIDRANSIIETDDETFMIAGLHNSGVGGLHVSADGDEIWLIRFADGSASAVIELKGGNYWICGGSNSRGYIVCFDIDGDVSWDESYGDEGRHTFSSMRETQGGVVLTGAFYVNADTCHAWAAKVDFDGELLWSRLYNFGNRWEYLTSLVSAQEDGFVAVGASGQQTLDRDNDILVIKFNGDGDLVWSRTFNPQPENMSTSGSCIERLDDGGFIVVGTKKGNSLTSYRKPYGLRLRSNGIERWNAVYDIDEAEGFGSTENSFRSVVRGNDNSIIAAGTVNYEENIVNEDEGQNGYIMKLEYDQLAPSFIYYLPGDTVFSVLQGDTVDFVARATDWQEDALTFLWIMDGDTVSEDTSASIEFDSVGVWDVRCEVSDGEFTVSVTWHVTVTEFYISDFTPDSLDLVIRRNTSVDFSLAVRQLVDEEIEYQWTLTDREGLNHEIGETDSASVLFDLKGEYIVEGLAGRDAFADSVAWTIDVRSVLWWWWPEELALSVPADTSFDFGIVPFNEDSDSLTFQWWLNNEQLEVDTTADSVMIDFPELGLQTVMSIVQDGIELDTVIWEINVFDPNSAVDSDIKPLPDCVSLSEPYPNPFNSVTRINYSIPEAAHVKLLVYDLSGREVAVLIDREQVSGRYTAVFDASHLPTGLYFARLNAGGEVRTKKVVLVR
ncbi:T9SS type A sorting domain-containing protein [bacterium]|nr:T9SS type A sorting domain-containing protein [bacterium]